MDGSERGKVSSEVRWRREERNVGESLPLQMKGISNIMGIRMLPMIYIELHAIEGSGIKIK